MSCELFDVPHHTVFVRNVGADAVGGIQDTEGGGVRVGGNGDVDFDVVSETFSFVIRFHGDEKFQSCSKKIR